MDIIMPKMGESVSEGTIIKWHKKVGQQVKRDEIIFEISTDKVDTEIPSPVDGVLQEIKANEGDTVEVGSVVAVVSENGSAPVKKETTAEKEPVKEKETQKEKEPEVKQTSVPSGNVIDIVDAMGIELLTEDQYRGLQELGEFDLKTSSWVDTPHKIRKLGGAIFCDRRYDHVFTYHNGANSFYGVRGFRGCLRV